MAGSYARPVTWRTKDQTRVRGRLGPRWRIRQQEREQAPAGQAAPADGADGQVPAAETEAGPVSRNSTAGRIDEMRRRHVEAASPTGPDAAEKQHRRGKLSARERIDLLLDPGSFVETDPLDPSPGGDVRAGRGASRHRRCHHRLGNRRRSQGVRLQPGLHRVRWVAGRDAGQEDLQGHGPRREERGSDHRHQRRRRRPDPGGRRVPGGLR